MAASRQAPGIPASLGVSWPGIPQDPAPSPSHSCAHWNENKMVIMLQTSSGKGSEADEKPYLRVRPLLLITRSEAVNSADTAIMGNEPAAVLDRRLPGVGWGWGRAQESRAGWPHGCCQVVSTAGAARPGGTKPLDSIWALWGDFLAFLGRLEG